MRVASVVAVIVFASHFSHAQHAHGGHGSGHGAHGGGRHGNPEDIEGYIARMESAERAAWQKPDQVVRALGVKKGQTLCDIGAGPGYFALRLARAVGHRGRVVAVDVEPRILEALRARLAEAKARNVTPVLALPDDPLLPERLCDLVILVNTYHHFPDGSAYLRRLVRSLAPGGRIAVIDFHKRELPVGPPVEEKIARGNVLADARRAGLALVRELDFLPHQYFLVLAPRR